MIKELTQENEKNHNRMILFERNIETLFETTIGWSSDYIYVQDWKQRYEYSRRMRGACLMR